MMAVFYPEFERHKIVNERTCCQIIIFYSIQKNVQEIFPPTEKIFMSKNIRICIVLNY